MHPVVLAGVYSTEQESVQIRDSGRAAGRLFALPMTLLTGKPHTGQRPVPMSPTAHVLGAGLSTTVGLAVSWFACARGGWWLLGVPAGWAMTLHGMRNARMMIYHQAAHRNLWARRRLDRPVGKAVSALLLTQNFDRYGSEHAVDHHAASHMTVRDPTVQAILLGLGLTPGMTRRQMWRGLLAKLGSPRFHTRFFLGRVQSYFRPAGWAERLLTVTAYGLVAALVTSMRAWPLVLVAWVLPVTVFYQVSNTLRLCVKHTFPPPGMEHRRGREYFASLTNAIFLGERAPGPETRDPKRAARWIVWWIRMLFVHFPARYLVLTGDTVVHDFHHRYPLSRDWGSYIFARQTDIDAGHRGWPPYRQVWGLVPAINAVFDSLSVVDPIEYSRQRIARVSRRDLFLAFDD